MEQQNEALGIRKELILTSPQAMMTTDTARASSIGTLIERDPLLTTMPNVVRFVYPAMCMNWILPPGILRQLSTH